MVRLERLTASELRAWIGASQEVLFAHRRAIDRLNVFPVPDADTGTNMSLTLDAAAAALEDGADMQATCRAIGRGALMGARGISGVILSEFLRSLADRFAGSPAVGAGDLADGLEAASRAADRAVAEPVEGTILTVARAAARGARSAVERGESLVGVVGSAEEAAREALARTPELLPALARAGVVDAGGSGLLLVLSALGHVVDGRALPEPERGSASVEAASVTGVQPSARYEVACLLATAEEGTRALKAAWSDLGDSVVVAGGDGWWACHVHTGDPERALAVAARFGTISEVRVTDLLQQVGGGVPPSWSDRAPTGIAVVAVCSGAGMSGLLADLGASRVVPGGPSMNPSVADLLEAVEGVGAREVILLPNGDKALAAAERVGEATDRTVLVVPARQVSEGIAALRAFEPETSAQRNLERMREAAAHVRSGEVTQAIKDATWAGGRVRAGDWIGVDRGGIRAVGASIEEAATRLLEVLVRADGGLVTVTEGEGSAPASTERIAAWLLRHRPRSRVEVRYGGQPLYPYLFGAESTAESS